MTYGFAIFLDRMLANPLRTSSTRKLSILLSMKKSRKIWWQRWEREGTKRDFSSFCGGQMVELMSPPIAVLQCKIYLVGPRVRASVSFIVFSRFKPQSSIPSISFKWPTLLPCLPLNTKRIAWKEVRNFTYWALEKITRVISPNLLPRQVISPCNLRVVVVQSD